MANETFITIRGNASRDPERREAQHGPWARFSVGVTARFRDGEMGFKDRPTQWFEVRVYGNQADHVVQSVRKGTAVLVRGELRTDTWTTPEGEERSMQYIRAETVALDLHFRTYYTSEIRTEEESAVESAQTPDAFGVGDSGRAAWDTSPPQMGEAPVPVA